MRPGITGLYIVLVKENRCSAAEVIIKAVPQFWKEVSFDEYRPLIDSPIADENVMKIRQSRSLPIDPACMALGRMLTV